MLFLVVESDNDAVRDNHVASILVAASLGVVPLTGHDTLKKAAAVIVGTPRAIAGQVQLATEDVYQVVNRTLALEHQLLKIPKCNFACCHRLLNSLIESRRVVAV